MTSDVANLLGLMVLLGLATPDAARTLVQLDAWSQWVFEVAATVAEDAPAP